MKKLFLLALTPLAFIAMATYSPAQIIVWGSAQNMIGNSDVLDPGTLVDAATFYGSAVTINTVKFNPLTLSSGTYTDGTGIAITTPNGGAGAYTAPFSSTSPPSSTNYSNLTSVLGFTVGVTGTVTLSGLTVNDTYDVEAWSYYTGTTVGGYTQLTGSTPVDLASTGGQYALGTFTATGTTETFGYAVGAADNHAIINAVSVFDTSSSSAAPEPSTYALLGAGLLGLIVLVRRKVRA